MAQPGNNLRVVVLLDIDGTLLTGAKTGPTAGYLAMGQAARDTAGLIGAYDSVEFAGRTDEQIAHGLLEAAGESNPSQGRVNELVSSYLSFLSQNTRTHPYRVLGKPREAITALRRRGACVELGTGNVVDGARIKLKNAGIDDLFDFTIGGFGDGAGSRAELLARGAHKCDPAGAYPIIVVGDTPHDVRAAKEIGAACIGVPFGHNTAAILRTAGADRIIEFIDPSIVNVIESLLPDGG